jgi:chromosome segregation protein
LEELRTAVDAKRKIADENRATLNNLRAAHQQIQRSQFDAEKKVAVADTSIQNVQRAIFQMEEEREMRDQQIQHLEIEKGSKEQQLAEKQLELEQLQEHYHNTKELIAETQAHLEELRHNLADENRKLDSKKNEHDLLKSLVDKMEGYPESVKFLHNNPGWNHTAPILSDIIYVKEEYRAAVENVLEPYLNYYVVANLQEGLQAIHLLDASKKGKANFFLMDEVNNNGLHKDGHQPSGTIAAMDVIEVDAQYRSLAEQLLGNVYIADDESVLEANHDSVLLEKHGKYVKGKYVLSGGSVGLFEGKKIGRAKNLEKLREQIITQQAVVDDYNARIKLKHQEIIDLNANLKEHLIRETERELQQLNNQVFGLPNKIENLQQTQAQSRRRLEDLEDQLDHSHSSVESVRNDLATLNQQVADYAAQLQNAESEYRTIEVQYNEANAQYNNLNLQVTRQQSKLAALKQELQFKTNQLKDLETQVQNNSKQLAETSETIVQSSSNLLELEESLYELMRRREDEQSALNETDQAYYILRNQLSVKESELRQKTK